MSTTRVISVTQEYRDDAIALLREAHGEATAAWLNCLWDWKVKERPEGTEVEHYRIGVAEEGRLFGTVTLMPARVKIGQEIRNAGCMLDLVIDGAGGGRGVLANIFDICDEMISRCPSFLYGNTSQQVASLMCCGFDQQVILGRYARYHRVLAMEPALRARGPIPAWLIKPAAIAYEALEKVVDALAALRSPRDISIRRIDEFDSSFDSLWDWASPSYPNLTVRDRRFLTWRFRQLPDRRYVVLGAFRKSRLVGYTVLRPTEDEGLKKALIVDLFTHRTERGVFRKLIGAAVREARREKAAVISIFEMMQEEFRRELARFLFSRSKSEVYILAHSSLLPAAEYSDPSDWWFTLADSDLEITARDCK
jgi:hypothetical protein